jgi:hypothetical protein
VLKKVPQDKIVDEFMLALQELLNNDADTQAG